MAIAIMVLTAILVIVTGFYALQTKLMVDEMRRARGASITPKVALSFEHLGGPVSFPLLINCGVGPALEVDVKISYEPGETHFVWSSPLMVAGESIRFNGPDETLDMRKLIERYDRIVLTGQCQDAMAIPTRFDRS